MDGKMLARLGAVVFVAVAITATAIELTRKGGEPAAQSERPAGTSSADPLRDELRRCRRLGEAATRDPACLRAWADNRERFLAPGSLPAVPPPASPSQTR